MSAVAFRARSLLQRSWRATVALILLCGVTGGLVLVVSLSARRGNSSFDRFVEHSRPPNVIAGFCAPDASQSERRSETGCRPYDPSREAAAVGHLPGVQAASRWALVFGTYTFHGQATPGPISVMLDASQLRTSEGNPPVVEGRLADPNVAEEVMVSEEAARLYELDVGDAVVFTPTPPHPGDPGAAAKVRAAHLEIVGIVRTRADLVAGLNMTAAAFSDAVPFAGPAFWQRYGHAAQNQGILLVARVARHAPQSFEATMRDRFPARFFTFDLAPDPGVTTVSDAIGYETTAATAVAAGAAVAWLLLVGQTLVRRSVDEHADAATFAALGMTRQQMAAASVVRAVPVAVGVALVALLTAAVGSLQTPFGLAAKAEVGRRVWLDATVLAGGAMVIALVVVAGLASAALIGMPAGGRSGRERSRRRTVRLRSVAATVGLRLASPRRRRWLLLGLAAGVVALAAACAVAQLSLVGSLHHLVDHAEGYGVEFDGVVTGRNEPTLSDDNVDLAIRAVRDAPEVSAAAGVAFDSVTAGRAHVNLVGLWSIAGPTRPWSIITSGREPEHDREVAVGAKTMRNLRIGIGDHVDVTSSDAASRRLEVVGEVLFYDGFHVEPGEGALVSPQWFGTVRARKPDEILVSSDARHRRWKTIEQAGLTVLVPPPPAGVRNLRRVDKVPGVVSAVVGLLALGALLHAVAVVARSERRQLAVLRAIGFTRLQLAGALATTSSAIGGLGVLVGVPLGFAAQRWIWRALERQIGVASGARGDWTGVLEEVGLVLVIASFVGAASGWAASRRSVADALRAE